MKKALTVGELLVTMAIIGVIAVLVLPGFIKDYNSRLYTTRLKKTVELIEAAVNQACVDNNVSSIGQTPYVVNDNKGTKQQAFIDKYFKTNNIEKVNPFAAEYLPISGDSKYQASALAKSHGWAKLSSGEALSMYCAGENVSFCVFRVDVNSLTGPNMGGRDFFSLFVDRSTNEIYDRYPSSDCIGSGQAYGCYAKLIENNWEMNY